MKKKLTVNSLAAGNLKKRRKQYTILIIGVILAMMFSSGVLFFVTSFMNSMEEYHKSIYGKEKIILLNTDSQVCEQGVQEQLFTRYGTAHLIGYAFSDMDEQSKGAAVAWLDEDARELSYQTLKEGRMPEKDGEIAVEQQVLLSLGLSGAVPGDTVTLQVAVPNGTDFSEEVHEKTYTLTGIVNDKKSRLSSDMMYGDESQYRYLPGIFVCPDSFPDAGGRELQTCYVDFPLSQSFSEDFNNRCTKFFENHSIEHASICYITLNMVSTSESDSMLNTLILGVTLAVTLTVISCIGIINAFQTNLRERRAQIGMLRAVGATRRQIIHIFGREALLISLICAPVSVLLSYFGVKLIIRFLGENYVFLPNIPVLLASAGIGVVCVMLAALIPLSSASRTSPMQSIRNININRKMVRRKIHSQKQFSCPKLIARRNLTFYRGRRAAVSILLILTIFLSCFGFSYIQSQLDNMYIAQYDYSVSLTRSTAYSNHVNIAETEIGYTENDRYRILSDSYVDKVYGDQTCLINMLTDDLSDYLRLYAYNDGGMRQINFIPGMTRENYRQMTDHQYSEEYLQLRQTLDIQQNMIAFHFGAAAPDLLSILQDSVVEGKINLDKINSGEEIIVIAPEKLGLRLDESPYGDGAILSVDTYLHEQIDYLETAENSLHAGDTLSLCYLHAKDSATGIAGIVDDRTDKTVTIGAVLHELPSQFLLQTNGMIGGFWGFCFLTSNSGMQTFTQQEKYDSLQIYLKNGTDDTVQEHMESLLTEITAGSPNSNLYSNYAFIQQQKRDIRTALVMMISIMLLFFTISASLISNSLTAQIRESKREIGTLRAVGAGLRELSESYIRQLVSMFSWGYGIGFGGYTLTWLIIFLVCKSYGTEYALPFSIWQTLLVGIVIFIVCALSLHSQLKKQMKYSIVENIREL